MVTKLLKSAFKTIAFHHKQHNPNPVTISSMNPSGHRKNGFTYHLMVCLIYTVGQMIN